MVWVFQRLLLGFILIVVASGVLFFSTLDSVEPVAREYLGQPGSGSHRGIQALWISGDNTVALAFDGIVKVAIDRRLSLIVNDQEFDQRGVLAAVGIGWEQSCKRAAAYVARVLGGERTATMPFENFARMRLDLNHALANKLGITIPTDLIREAEGARVALQ